MKSASVGEEAPGRRRGKRPSVETAGRTGGAGGTGGRGGTGRSGRFQQVREGVRRSPRTHAQSVVVPTSSDEETDQASDGVSVGEDVQLRLTALNSRPLISDDAHVDDVAIDVAADDVGDGTHDGDDDVVDEDDDAGADADEVVDVVENDNEDGSTTQSLSTSLSPYEAQQTEDTHDAEHWLGVGKDSGDREHWLYGADTTRNSLLYDADAAYSVSSEADSVDVVSSLAVDDRHAAETRELGSPTLMLAAAESHGHSADTQDLGSPTLMLAAAESNETRLQELEEFVDRSVQAAASVMEVTEDVDISRSADGVKMVSHVVELSPSWPQLNESVGEQTGSAAQPASATAGVTQTHVADVRRGAMWRDSLFPSDLPAEPAGSCEAVISGKSMSLGKPGVVGKPGPDRGDKMSLLSTQRTLSLDWDATSHTRTADNCATSSSSQPCGQNFSTVSSPHYRHYVDKSAELGGGGGLRYDSGRRSVNDVCSQGVMYDGTQQQRAASVRPQPSSAAASADAHRLSHMWGAGAPLPAHQHHISLSHLQHLVTDDLQYPPTAVGHATPSSQNAAAADFVRACPQPPQRHHGSRQQHRTHHKQPAATTAAAGQLMHSPLSAAAAASYDMFSACRIQQPISYFPHQSAAAAAALPMGVVGLHHAQMAVAAAANFGQPMPAGQAANSAMYSAAAAAAYNYLNGGGLQPFNVDINSVMRR